MIVLPTFRWLLLLYPAEYRSSFGEEMLEVLSQSLSVARRQGMLSLLTTSIRETKGLLFGAANEHLRECFGKYPWLQVAGRRLHMRSEFRYPRATVPMMLMILACIMLVIYRARAIEARAEISGSVLPSVPLTFGVALLLTGIAGAVGWLILHSLRRSGVHRLSEAQTWPQGK